MTEKHGQKKLFGWTVVIVLVLVCMVLAASLVGVVAIYLIRTNDKTDMTEITELEAENANLQGNLTLITNQLSAVQSSLSQANANLESIKVERDAYAEDILDLKNNTEYLKDLLQLGESSIILNNTEVELEAGEDTAVFEDAVQYAGYCVVQVESDSATTFVQMIFSYGGFDFDNIIVVGEDDIAAFPVLPGEIAIIIGNTEVSEPVNANVSAIYVY